MTRRETDLLNIRGAKASLAGSGAVKRQRNLLKEVGLKLNHPCRGKKQSGIAGRHQRIGRNDRVPLFPEKIEKSLANILLAHDASFNLKAFPVAEAIT